MDLALVDVQTRPIIRSQLVASLTRTTIRTEYIDATLVTNTRLLLALIHIVASLFGRRVLPESLVAFTRV